jgi:hypothetical protein
LTVRGMWALVLAVTAAIAADGPKLPVPTSDERHDAMRRAHVWEPTDVAAQDLYNGAESKAQFAVGEEITCDFYPKPMAGLTEKFLCKLEDGRIFKVKYNASDRFKEANSEVLGTRLFQALGFFADKMFPVRVTCRGCPKLPWNYVRQKKAKRFLDAEGMITNLPPEAEVGTYTFDPAALEELLDVQTIERKKDEGWSWRSLKRVDAAAGGSTRAEADALKLLCAFVQNSDNKAKQNRLACPRDEIVEEGGHITCRRPIMYVDDLGSVFGKGGFITGYDGRMNYDGWKELRVWKDDKTCRARLKGIGGIFRPSNLRNPKISEEGRALLAQQLSQLSDDQIADLFKAGRIEGLHQKIGDDDDNESREVTIDDWVALFKMKRDQITQYTGCLP